MVRDLVPQDLHSLEGKKPPNFPSNKIFNFVLIDIPTFLGLVIVPINWYIDIHNEVPIRTVYSKWHFINFNISKLKDVY